MGVIFEGLGFGGALVEELMEGQQPGGGVAALGALVVGAELVIGGVGGLAGADGVEIDVEHAVADGA